MGCSGNVCDITINCMPSMAGTEVLEGGKIPKGFWMWADWSHVASAARKGLATTATTCLTFQSRPDGCVVACSKSRIMVLMSCMFRMHVLLHFTTNYTGS